MKLQTVFSAGKLISVVSGLNLARLLAPPPAPPIWCTFDVIGLGPWVEWIIYNGIRWLNEMIWAYARLPLGAAAVVVTLREAAFGALLGPGGLFEDWLFYAGASALIFFVFAISAWAIVTAAPWLFKGRGLTTYTRIMMMLVFAGLLAIGGVSLSQSFYALQTVTSRTVFNATNLGVQAVLGTTGSVYGSCVFDPESPAYCTGLNLALGFLSATRPDLEVDGLPPGFRNQWFSTSLNPNVEVLPEDFLAWTCEQRAYSPELFLRGFTGATRLMSSVPLSILAVLEEVNWLLLTLTTIILFFAAAFFVGPAFFSYFSAPLDATINAGLQLILVGMLAGLIMGAAVGVISPFRDIPMLFAGASCLSMLIYLGVGFLLVRYMFETFGQVRTAATLGIIAKFDLAARMQNQAAGFGMQSTTGSLADNVRDAAAAVQSPLVAYQTWAAGTQAGLRAGAAFGGVGMMAGAMWGGAHPDEAVRREEGAREAWANRGFVGKVMPGVGGMAAAAGWFDPDNAATASERVVSSGLSGASTGAALGAVVGQPILGAVAGAAIAAGAETLNKGEDYRKLRDLGNEVKGTLLAVHLANLRAQRAQPGSGQRSGGAAGSRAEWEPWTVEEDGPAPRSDAPGTAHAQPALPPGEPPIPMGPVAPRQLPGDHRVFVGPAATPTDPDEPDDFWEDRPAEETPDQPADDEDDTTEASE